MDFPLPSNAQIEAHADLYDESICLHPAFKRPKGRPKNTKRKAGYMEKQGKKRISTFQVCYKADHTKKTCPNRAKLGESLPWRVRVGVWGAPKEGSGKCRNKARVAAATKKGVRGANDYARASRTNSPVSFVLSDILWGL